MDVIAQQIATHVNEPAEQECPLCNSGMTLELNNMCENAGVLVCDNTKNCNHQIWTANND